MTLKLACADFTFPLLPHDKSLDLIAMLGFEGVDIGLFEGRSHLWPSRVFADLKSSAKELKRKLRDRGLELADVFLQTAPDFVSIAPNHPDLFDPSPGARLVRANGRVRPRVRRPARLGPAGRHFADEPEAESYERCRDELAWRCQAAGSQGVTFSVEAHVGSIVPTPESAARLVQSVPGLTLTLDYTHFTRSRRSGPRRGALDRPRQPLSRPRRPAGPPSGIIQGERDRLRTRSRRHAASRLRGLCRRRIRLDRLGALQRGRQPVGNDLDARLSSQARESQHEPARPRARSDLARHRRPRVGELLPPVPVRQGLGVGVVLARRRCL